MYILLCSNGKYYTGSTNNLEKRILQHNNGEGANFTRKHLPVQLIYFEEFDRIDDAFYREKQIQGWSMDLLRPFDKLRARLSRAHGPPQPNSGLASAGG